MFIKFSTALAVWALMPSVFAAQETAPLPDPSDPQAAGLPFIYESVFQGYQAMPEASGEPHEAWRSANHEAGRIGGHAGYVKDMESRHEKRQGQDLAPAHQRAGAHHGQHQDTGH